jgi:hypothetical protein
MEKSPLAIPDRIKPPNPMRFRVLAITTTIAATITDNRNKTILYKLVRLAVQIGCRINCHLDTLADIDLFGYATNEITGKGQFMWLYFKRPTGSIAEPPDIKLSSRLDDAGGLKTVCRRLCGLP